MIFLASGPFIQRSGAFDRKWMTRPHISHKSVESIRHCAVHTFLVGPGLIKKLFRIQMLNVPNSSTCQIHEH
jgi:hypothetical protein